MFCEKCGNEIENNQGMCSNCSASTNSPTTSTLEEDTNYNYEVSEPTPKKSGSKKIVLFVGIIVLLIATTLTVFASTSNIFKSPKQIYLNAESKNFKELVANLKDEGSYIDNVKKMMEQTHQTENEFSVSLDLNYPAVDLAPVTQVLNNSKLVINTKSNPEKDQKLVNADILINNNKLIDVMAALENNVFTLSVPVLLDKYIVADFNQTEKILENLGFSGDFSGFSSVANMITPQDLLDVLSSDNNQFNSILKDYSKVLKNSIDKEQVSIEKNVEFKVGEFDLKCNKLTITFGESDIQRMIINLVDATAESDELYELFKDTIKNIYELFEDNPELSSELKDFEEIEDKFSQEKFKEEMNKLKVELEKAFEDFVLPEDISMSIYTNKKEIVGRTINAKFASVGINQIIGFDVNYSGVTEYKNRNIKDLEVKLSSGNSSNASEVTFAYILDGNINKETESGKKNFSIAFGSTGFSTKILKLDADYNIISDSKSNSVETSHDYNMSAGLPSIISINASGNTKINTWEKTKEKQFGRDIDFNTTLSIPDTAFFEGVSLSLGLNAKNKNTFDIDFDLPSFDSSNSIELVNVTEDELMQVMAEIEASFTNFLEENQDLINLFQLF